MNVMINIEDVRGFIQYNCPHCNEINFILLEILPECLVVSVSNFWQHSGHKITIEFDSPNCEVCGKPFNCEIRSYDE